VHQYGTDYAVAVVINGDPFQVVFILNPIGTVALHKKMRKVVVVLRRLPGPTNGSFFLRVPSRDREKTMNGIPVRKAIESGSWYECIGRYFNEELRFRLRVLGFSATTVGEIDETLGAKMQTEGVLWLLSIQVVSLCKEPVDAWKVRDVVMLTDRDAFSFKPFEGSDLDRNEASGIFRFSGWSSNPPLSPKVKATGSIPFILPDEENNYCVAVEGGQIREA
jgi:hypothetical protein